MMWLRTAFLSLPALLSLVYISIAEDSALSWATDSPWDLNGTRQQQIDLGDAEYYKLDSETSQAGILHRIVRNNGARPGSATNTHSCSHVRGVPSNLRSATHMAPSGLTNFYQKYTEAYGIPIIASNSVSDEALKRACYIVRFLFADRYDVRNSYYKYYGRMGVIGRNQQTTTMPEHSHLDASYWDARARGLGATSHRPICTAGEENFLCEKKDRYYDEDIGIHELAHGVDNLGATYAISGFGTRLTNAYNSAKSRGLWANTYSMSTADEYFSEATRAYFNVKPYKATADGVRNNIVTRDQLKSYDPTLYALVKEVFPCGNQFIKRCPGSGKSAADLRRAETQQVLTTCSGGMGTGTGTGTGSCVDKNEHCVYWAGTGECNKNPNYMNVNCKSSCNRCSTTGTGGGTTETCQDTDTSGNCGYWANTGECQKNSAYMHANCKKSCNIC